MLERFAVIVILLCVLHCGDAFLLRFPGKLTHFGSSAVRPVLLNSKDGEEAEPIAPVAKIGSRRFVRRIPTAVAPVKAPKAEILVKKAVKEESDTTLEEDEDEEIDYENPNWEEVTAPPERYNKTFVCFADITSPDMREKRSELFSTHMQWARRSHLSQDLEEHENTNNTLAKAFYRPEKAFVQHDYTLLTEDCTAPATQLVIIRSDDVQHVHDCLSQEPLSAHHALSPWKVYEFVLESNSSTTQSIDEEHEENKLSEIFHNPLESGVMLLSLCKSVHHTKGTKGTSNSTTTSTTTTTSSDTGATTSTSTSTSTDIDSSGYNMTKLDELTDLVDASYKYHADAARLEYVNPADRPVETEHYQPLYNNFSRIVTFGRLYHTDPPMVKAKGGKKGTSGSMGGVGAEVSSGDNSSDTVGSVDTTATTSTTESSTTTTTTATTTTHRRGRIPNPFVEPMYQPEHLAGVLLMFNAVSRADALRYLKRDPVGGMGVEPHTRKGLHMSATSTTHSGNSSTVFDRMTLSKFNVQDVHGKYHYLGSNWYEQNMFDALHFADPEDLLLQNTTYTRLYTDRNGVVSTKGETPLPPLPHTPMHYVNNVNFLKQLVAYNVSYRYNRMPESPSLRHIYAASTLARQDYYKTDSTREEARNRRRKGSYKSSIVRGSGVGGVGSGGEGDGEGEDGGVSMGVVSAGKGDSVGMSVGSIIGGIGEASDGNIVGGDASGGIASGGGSGAATSSAGGIDSGESGEDAANNAVGDTGSDVSGAGFV